ncbi:MAG TPA: chromate efflux transporter [Spirochaetota bacterium]|nr:chromate efflux transporter [Spirochaetota bacterium]HPS85176.1 chromate efflux transporter [Spirochaetota bacterium]
MENKSLIKAILEVFAVSLKLGLTSFGGPIAHLGYYHNEYVDKRKWLDERSYLDLVALCQFLPGPASTQISIAIGTFRAGLTGGIAAWCGFTLPSAVMMVLFAFVLRGFNIIESGWLHGLKIVAAAIVAQAILTMWQRLITDRISPLIAIAVFIILLFWQSAFNQIIIIAAAGAAGLFFYRKKELPVITEIQVPVSRKTAVLCLTIFFILLVLLPVARNMSGNQMISVADSFYRSGSLVFGGGHVVLPLLEHEVVPTGWVTRDVFLAGYGAAQGVPGPLFTFAAYLGAMLGGIKFALIALIAIFLPAYLLIIGALPFWNMLRNNSKIQGALTGINAGVVGILLAALYNPVWISAIFSKYDLALAVLLFGMLFFIKLPPWIIVIAGASGGMILEAIKF